MPTVADILRRYGPDYLARHGHDIEPHEAKTLRDLMACRTPAMGGHVWKCGQCGHQHYRYHSCRDRHCPTCGGPAKGRWFDRMLEWKLPVEYLHSVFTLPHGPLLEMVLMNARLLYGLLFRSAWKALSQEPAKRFGIRAIPTQIFFDKQGKEVYRHVGFMGEAEIDRVFKKMGVT